MHLDKKRFINSLKNAFYCTSLKWQRQKACINAIANNIINIYSINPKLLLGPLY